MSARNDSQRLRQQWTRLLLVAAMGALAGFPVLTRGEDADEIVAVYSNVSPGYHRTRLDGGTFKSETYAFGEGGSRGGNRRDSTFDAVPFMDVARTIAPALAAAQFLPCDRSAPKQTDLLIMVYWGATIGTDNTSSSAEYQIAQSLRPPPAPPVQEERIDTRAMLTDACESENGRMHADARLQEAEKNLSDSALQQSLTLMSLANRRRDKQDFENAAILGFLPEMSRFAGYQTNAFGTHRQDLADEVSESRYYVVLMAYDFQAMYQRHEKKLLWQTRFSIRQRRNDFSRQLAPMAQSAAHYFGQDSRGIQHRPMPEGHVDLGEPVPLDTVPDGK